MQNPGVDYSRKWRVLISVGMGVFLATIDSSIVNVTLPTLVRELKTDFPTVQWVVLGYLLTLATVILTMGRLGDMIGKKPIYMTGFVVFTLGSVLCGLAPTILWLIGFRVLQAVGAAMLMALGMAILTEAFPPSERGRALGISGALVSIGIVVGPTLGGLILDQFNWRWIFYVNLPVGILGTLLARRNIPSLRPAIGQRFDLAGALTLFGSLISLLLGLTIGQQVGFAQPMVLLLVGLWVVLLVLFLRIEKRTAQPMIDLTLFQNKLFSVNLITGAATFISIAGTIFLMPFFLENVLGYPPRQVGFLLAIVPIALGIAAPVSGALSDRFGTRPITAIGLFSLLVGYTLVSRLDADAQAGEYLLRFLPVGMGMGIFQSPNNSAIMGLAPRDRLGVASGLLSLTRILGQITGIAMLGAVWSGRVRFYVGSMPSGGAADAPAAAQALGLQDTLLVVVVIISLALLLGLWAFIHERRERTIAAMQA